MKPTVYIETSVVSYLTSRPSRDLIAAARQERTLSWWEHPERMVVIPPRPLQQRVVVQENADDYGKR